jgi:NAD(P)H-quinone oxidoreductase subunit 5
MLALPQALLVAAPPLALLATGLIPSSFANRHPRGMRTAVVALSGLCLAAAAGAAALLAMNGPVDHVFAAAPFLPALNIGVFFDSLAAVMVLLIGFVGLVIARFSVRYLDGDTGQGRFYRWLAFTMGAVLLMVVSRNLVMFTVAWMLTSIGLHQLLEHYPDRPWAIWAARKKFLISRLGDALLIAAVALTFWHFGSTDYSVVFAQADALRSSGNAIDPVFPVIAMLLVLGAMTKSAQFPFHSWLPDTMEAPTPVSALMHAGIINAGGFLVIRMSPLVTLSHVALDVLIVVGAFTALFGGLVMLSQTSIKRALAFSTIAQMGFMMLQCGLGAFSAALLHIVAHSLYKAHAFLAAGSVLDSAARLKTDARPAVYGLPALLLLPIAVVIAVGIGLGSLAIANIDIAHKSGGLVLGIVMVIAVTTLVWHGLVSGSVKLALASIVGGFIVSGIYLAGYQGVDRLLASSAVAREALPASSVDVIVGALVIVGFLGVFAIQVAASWLARLPVVRALYVHAANGFYCDIPARQITARVWGLNAPVP